jgi:protease I
MTPKEVIMPDQLEGKRVAILVDRGFEQIEMTKPRQALEDAGAETDLISPAAGAVQAVEHNKPGDRFSVDVNLGKANPDEYDALLLPGGVANPDKLRMNPDAVKFVKSFVDAGKPIAAICHGPWTPHRSRRREGTDHDELAVVED